MENAPLSRLANTATLALRPAGWRAFQLVLVLLAGPWLARSAVAQRPATVAVSATVVGPMMTYGFVADTTNAVARPGTRRVPIAGSGAIDFQSSAGAAIRVASREPARPAADPRTAEISPRSAMRVVQVTVDFVDN